MPDGDRQKRQKEMEERALRQREVERQRFLLNMDPGSWKSLAEEGYFQKGEDDFKAAAEAEKAVRGVSDRYCVLLHSLGALLDQRSSVCDTDHERHMISFRSALFLEESIRARRERAAILGKLEADEELRLSETILLKARGLCDYALDGGGPDMTR